jgi:hypothetical protein
MAGMATRRGAFIGAAVAVTLASAGVGVASPGFHNRDTFTYRIDMSPAAAMPRADAPKTASGLFAATLVIVRGRKLATLTWQLEVSGLSSTRSGYVEAHVHKGRPGNVGSEVIRLCGP